MLQTIGIIGAMEEELEYIRQFVDVVTEKDMAGMHFYVGRFRDMAVVLVRSGIGKVNAAICTQVLIDCFAVDKVVCIGVAGALASDLRIGDIVVSIDACQHDMDCSVFGDPVGTIPRMDCSFFPADEELRRLALACGQEAGLTMKEGRIASGDQFISEKAQKERIQRTVGGDCAEMESAAIAHTCYLNDIPFVILRAISDQAEGDAAMDFNTFVKQAALNAGILIKAMLQAM